MRCNSWMEYLNTRGGVAAVSTHCLQLEKTWRGAGFLGIMIERGLLPFGRDTRNKGRCVMTASGHTEVTPPSLVFRKVTRRTVRHSIRRVVHKCLFRHCYRCPEATHVK